MITANATSPNQVTANPFENAAGLMGGAKDIYKSFADGSFMSNINDYINPYYSQILDAAMGRMTQARDQSVGRVGDVAMSSGAFGGSRHGLAEGQIYSDFNRDVGEMSANLASQGFDRGLASMFQTAGNMQNLGSNYFNVGQTLNQNQAMAGGQQQELMNMILGGGSQQFAQMMQSPYQTINLLQAILSSDPRNNAAMTTGQSTPGLFDYLSLAAQAMSGMGG
jgi:hypothetical protein